MHKTWDCNKGHWRCALCGMLPTHLAASKAINSDSHYRKEKEPATTAVLVQASL